MAAADAGFLVATVVVVPAVPAAAAATMRRS
eukprot:CAMPEP_0203695626 /NCGR_PEP_ID=MMETSP0091-20130426/7045_1 /ASSEMBLY_ACC=CAM_ASM_001089 /TAXON_ID=426623 /ORGANISM="Chaetoceros affinis, Strain CCMP159" /LENGTH=30 /DNA_ID= /DNA_START= /DNA_END= /DNA_ORIENTATION=